MNVCRRAIGLASSIPFILLVTILAALQVHADFVPDHAGLSGIHGWIAELGDFDSDKHTDMFVVREEKNENTGAFLRAHIDVYLYRSRTLSSCLLCCYLILLFPGRDLHIHTPFYSFGIFFVCF